MITRYDHPAHDIESHSIPYNILEIIEYGGIASPHGRRIADNKYSDLLRGGEIIFYPKHCDHEVWWEKKVKFTLLTFKPQLFEQEFGFSSSGNLHPLFQEHKQDIYDLFNLMIRGLENNFLDNNYIDCLALAMANYLTSLMGLKNQAFPKHIPSKQELREVLDFIESKIEYGEHPAIPELTKLVGLESQSYFIKLFQKEMGITPSKYIKKRAIERAKYLLKNTDMKIIDISAKCGFSLTQFNHTFKKMTGVTPKEYRAEFR